MEEIGAQGPPTRPTVSSESAKKNGHSPRSAPVPTPLEVPASAAFTFVPQILRDADAAKAAASDESCRVRWRRREGAWAPQTAADQQAWTLCILGSGDSEPIAEVEAAADDEASFHGLQRLHSAVSSSLASVSASLRRPTVAAGGASGYELRLRLSLDWAARLGVAADTAGCAWQEDESLVHAPPASEFAICAVYDGHGTAM